MFIVDWRRSIAAPTPTGRRSRAAHRKRSRFDLPAGCTRAATWSALRARESVHARGLDQVNGRRVIGALPRHWRRRPERLSAGVRSDPLVWPSSSAAPARLRLVIIHSREPQRPAKTATTTVTSGDRSRHRLMENRRKRVTDTRATVATAISSPPCAARNRLDRGGRTDGSGARSSRKRRPGAAWFSSPIVRCCSQRSCEGPGRIAN